jgi:hypothetical protein
MAAARGRPENRRADAVYAVARTLMPGPGIGQARAISFNFYRLDKANRKAMAPPRWRRQNKVEVAN